MVQYSLGKKYDSIEEVFDIMMYRRIPAVILAASFSLFMAACGKEAEETAAKAPETTAETTIAETSAAVMEAVKEDVGVYKISGGTWFFEGKEDEKSIDMDGLKGFTSYTPEAIPEQEGYLKYLGENDEGQVQFDVLDMSGRQFMSLTFTSSDQFYVDDDEEQYYVKWDYE